MIVSESVVEIIDEEWLALIEEAREIGLTIDAVQEFFDQQRKEK